MSFPPRPRMVTPRMPCISLDMIPMPLPPHMLPHKPGVRPPAQPGVLLPPPPDTTKPQPLPSPTVSKGQGPSSKETIDMMPFLVNVPSRVYPTQSRSNAPLLPRPLRVPPLAYHAPPRSGKLLLPRPLRVPPLVPTLPVVPLMPPPDTPKPPPIACPPPATTPVSNGQEPSSNSGETTDGTPVTVFVGNVTPRAPDVMIHYILTACGPVLNWKRISAFGFCKFASPEAGLRCVRLLHDREIGEMKMVVRVYTKSKVLLDKYKTEQRNKLRAGGNAGVEDTSDGTPHSEDYMDDEQRSLDKITLKRIKQLIAEYQDDLIDYAAIQKEERMDKLIHVLEEADIEEEKHDEICREIGKFRKSMKVGSRHLTLCHNLPL